MVAKNLLLLIQYAFSSQGREVFHSMTASVPQSYLVDRVKESINIENSPSWP